MYKITKVILFSIITVLSIFVVTTSTAGADNVDEVGSRIMVAEPKAKPFYANKNGTKYWPCDGYINKKLIPAIHVQLSSMSKHYGVATPEINPCYYSIGSLNIGGGSSIPTFIVHMYTSERSMKDCVYKDFCSDSRDVYFMIKDKALHLQFMIVNLEKKLTEIMCMSLAGKIVNIRGHCNK